MSVHGTVTEYVKGCKCFRCRVARSRWEQARQQAIADGKPYTTTGEKTSARLELYRAAGYTLKAIGRPIGMEGTVLKRIMEEPDGMVLRSTEDRVLSLKVSDIEPGRVTAIGTTRRLRDLALQGWRSLVVAEEAGVSENTVRNVLLYRNPVIAGTTAERLNAAFERLSRQSPPDDWKSAAWARKSAARGWKRAAHWDDIDGSPVKQWEHVGEKKK